MIHDTQRAQISQKQDKWNLYAIMKTMFPPGYHHNGFATTHALGHMIAYIYKYIIYNYMYIHIYLYIYIIYIYMYNRRSQNK